MCIRDRVNTDAKIEVKGNPIPYVSRGGLKLEKAMKNFDITLQDKVCMDIGASTEMCIRDRYNTRKRKDS